MPAVEKILHFPATTRLTALFRRALPRDCELATEFIVVRGYLEFYDAYSLLNVCKRDSEQQDFSHCNAEHPAELPAFTICFQFVLRYLICENLSNLYIACLESWFCMINLC